MQSKGSRIAVVLGVIAVAVVAFLVLRPGGDGGEQVAGSSDDPAGERQKKPGGVSEGEKAGDRGGPAKPDVTKIAVKDGAPVGGVADIEVQSDEGVELLVESDLEEEVHVHGYGEFEDVAPGRPARLEFPADIEGVFEVELEHSHTQIARLEVKP